jgi:hypothetical protein
VHDDQGMDVGRDGRVVGEDGMGGRRTAMLVRTGRGVVAECERERQQVSLRRALVVADRQAAEAGVEALVLAEDLVGSSRHRGERDGQGDDERRALALGKEPIDAFHRPVGEGIDDRMTSEERSERSRKAARTLRERRMMEHATNFASISARS